MLAATQQDLETFLTQVYRAIAGAAPLKDKASSLSRHLVCTEHQSMPGVGLQANHDQWTVTCVCMCHEVMRETQDNDIKSKAVHVRIMPGSVYTDLFLLIAHAESLQHMHTRPNVDH